MGEGFLSYDDLSIIEPDSLMEMGEFDQAQANAIVEQAEAKAKEAEQAAALDDVVNATRTHRRRDRRA